MRILFDHGVPRPLANHLRSHAVTTARQMGWERLANGDLLSAAEAQGFDIFLTTDQRIRYQQNLAGRKIAIVVIAGDSKWSRVQLFGRQIEEAAAKSTPGSYIEVFVSFR